MKFKCEVCGEIFNSESEISEHLMYDHSLCEEIITDDDYIQKENKK